MRRAGGTIIWTFSLLSALHPSLCQTIFWVVEMEISGHADYCKGTGCRLLAVSHLLANSMGWVFV